MFTVRQSLPTDSDRVVEIWQKAVDATHHFLSDGDRHSLGELIAGFLPVAPLLIAVDASDRAVAFMLIDAGHMEALFVDPDYHGMGIGAALVRRGLADYPAMTTDVNEQNPGALNFYEKMGFERVGRSELDGQGRPYPLIHLKYAD